MDSARSGDPAGRLKPELFMSADKGSGFIITESRPGLVPLPSVGPCFTQGQPDGAYIAVNSAHAGLESQNFWIRRRLGWRHGLSS